MDITNAAPVDAAVTVQPSSLQRKAGETAETSAIQEQMPTDEAVAFVGLSNAVLQSFDRTFDTVKLRQADREVINEQIRSRAAEVVKTLKIHVKDEIESIRTTELGVLKARERQLMGDVTAKQQRIEELQAQLKTMKEALEAIRKKHAEELQKQHNDLAAQFSTEVAALKAQHAEVVKQLEAQPSLLEEEREAEKLQKHYQKMLAFHASHLRKLQGEIDGLIALGSLKEADACLEYLRYHQMELAKVKGMLHLTAESGSMHDDAVQALKNQYASDASRAELAGRAEGQTSAMHCNYAEEIERLRGLRNPQGPLAGKGLSTEAPTKTADVDAIRAEHAATLAKLKEQHREEMYRLQARQAKLQKELSLRLDPLQISSQDSGISLSGTLKRRLRASRETMSPRRNEYRAAEDAEMMLAEGSGPVELPRRNLEWWANQENLLRQLGELDGHYDDMHAKRGRLEDYER